MLDIVRGGTGGVSTLLAWSYIQYRWYHMFVLIMRMAFCFAVLFRRLWKELDNVSSIMFWLSVDTWWRYPDGARQCDCISCWACRCRLWGGVRYHCFTFAFSDITWRSLERVPGPVETNWSIIKCMLQFEHTRTYRKTTKPISPYWTLWGPLEEYQNILEHNTRTLPCWTRWSPIGPYRNIWKHIKRTFQVNHMNT